MLSTSAPSPGRLIGHVVAEYAHGRRLVDVLNDPYVVRHATLEQRRLLLEQPELIRALADDGAADRSGRS